MKNVTLKCATTIDGLKYEASGDVELPENVTEDTECYGEERQHAFCDAEVNIKLQGGMRRVITSLQKKAQADGDTVTQGDLDTAVQEYLDTFPECLLSARRTSDKPVKMNEQKIINTLKARGVEWDDVSDDDKAAFRKLYS